MLAHDEILKPFNLTNINRNNAQLSVDLLKISSRLYFDTVVSTALDYCLAAAAAHQNHTNKTITVYKTPQILEAIREYLQSNVDSISFPNSDNITSDTIAACLKNVCQRSGVKRDSVMHLLRLGLTGSQIGSPVVELIQLLSVSESIDRINKLHNCLLVNQRSQCNEAL
ncbi:unnamed protein product [Trichobilharzia regenti]|nr:unnamed protein product [Trichobilharzia regenti]